MDARAYRDLTWVDAYPSVTSTRSAHSHRTHHSSRGTPYNHQSAYGHHHRSSRPRPRATSSRSQIEPLLRHPQYVSLVSLPPSSPSPSPASKVQHMLMLPAFHRYRHRRPRGSANSPHAHVHARSERTLGHRFRRSIVDVWKRVTAALRRDSSARESYPSRGFVIVQGAPSTANMRYGGW